MIGLVLKSVVAGLIVASPTGPVSIRAIQKTINNGKKAGMSAGMGIVVANLIFAFIVTIGFARVSVLLEKYDYRFQLLNIVFLSVFFFVNLKKGRQLVISDIDVSEKKLNSFKEFRKSLVLCLSNPSTIISFLIIFNLLQISVGANAGISLFCILSGLFIGAITWWSAITFYIGKKEEFISDDFRAKTQKMSSLLILLLLLVTLSHFIFEYHLI